MKKPYLGKYYDDKLVRLQSLSNIESFSVCETKIQAIKSNGIILELEFDTYENAIKGLELIKLKLEENWEEEFEDELWFNFKIGWHTIKSKLTLDTIVEKYLGNVFSEETSNKVNIKVRKGAILIERMD